MTKTFCDYCGVETTGQFHVNSQSVMIHLRGKQISLSVTVPVYSISIGPPVMCAVCWAEALKLVAVELAELKKEKEWLMIYKILGQEWCWARTDSNSAEIRVRPFPPHLAVPMDANSNDLVLCQVEQNLSTGEIRRVLIRPLELQVASEGAEMAGEKQEKQ